MALRLIVAAFHTFGSFEVHREVRFHALTIAMKLESFARYTALTEQRGPDFRRTDAIAEERVPESGLPGQIIQGRSGEIGHLPL
jgi:hypothetical protein